MAQSSSIEWTESTWNPLTGCTKVSPGCANCYAERMALRLKAMGNPNYANGFSITMHEEVLELPLKWRRPQTIFVNSMSDLFHEDLSFEIIERIFKVMKKAYWHTFQVLTKRSHVLLEYNKHLNWPNNIWMGVTVESYHHIKRVSDLSKTDARIKFISFEPLLSAIGTVDLRFIDWVIAGGESGPGARLVREEWIAEIRDQCIEQNIPFFFKQWGGFHKKKNGRLLEEREWNEMPASSL